MLDFVMIGTNDLEKSSKFYDIILNEIDMIKVLVGERYVGYADKNLPDKIELYITKPQNKEPATNGNGTMIALLVKSKGQVDKFHASALLNGAINEGFPGPRPPNSKDYYSYIRDFSGNKICAYFK